MSNDIDKISGRLLTEQREATSYNPDTEKGAIYRGLRAAGASIGLGLAAIAHAVSDLKSSPETGDSPPYSVIINGSTYAVKSSFLTYDDVIKSAGYEPGTVLTVTYSRAPGNKEGSLLPGKVTPIMDGTVFDAVHTGNA